MLQLRVCALCVIITLCGAQLLELFGLSNGNTGTVERESFHDIASQSAGLINYLWKAQRDPENKIMKKLREPLPQVTFVDGLPAVPGLIGSLPGAGGCLPKNSPLVKQKSPSLLQNFMRNIPGAQDYLNSFLPTPDIQLQNLFGKYMWALDTPSVHDRFCPTTEFHPATKAGQAASFSLVEKFRTNSAQGGEKTAFGYGLQHRKATYVYFQDDPCPYQIVIAGPVNETSQQYEYVVLSNWARFPIIGLVRDIRHFYANYQEKLEDDLDKEGFLNSYSGHNTIIHYTDWSQCRPKTVVSTFRNIFTELFGL